jgi:hypothetical protein
MPVKYVINKKRGIVITTAWDRVTFEEARAHQVIPVFNQLLDGTGITALQVSTEEAKLLARNSPPFSPSSRRAWVAATPFLFAWEG